MMILAYIFAVLIVKDAIASNPHIYHGEYTKPHQYPWVVQVNSSNHYCAGTLLRPYKGVQHSDIVATAAHCVASCDSKTCTANPLDKIEIIGGSHWIRQKEETEQIATVVSIRFHESWKLANGECKIDVPITDCLTYDIALLKLDKKFKFDQYVQPLDLAEKDQKYHFDQCTIAGWGIADDWQPPQSYWHLMPQALVAMNVSILNNEKCIESWNNSDPIKFQNFICTIGENTPTTCPGDSGGPLWCIDKTGRPLLHGIISGGDEACGGSRPSLFTRITKFVDWIDQNTKLLNSGRIE